jgi:hypothetical protein
MAVKRTPMTDGIFTWERVTVDAHDPSDEAMNALHEGLQAISPEGRLRAIKRQLADLGDERGDLDFLRRERLRRTVQEAELAPTDRQLALIDLAEAHLRELVIYLSIVPWAHKHAKQRVASANGGVARSDAYRPLREWCKCQGSATSNARPGAVRATLYRQIQNEFARQAASNGRSDKIPSGIDPALVSAIQTLRKRGIKTVSTKAISNWVKTPEAA